MVNKNRNNIFHLELMNLKWESYTKKVFLDGNMKI